MRLALAVLAIVVLVAIGTAESAESARQLSELPRRARPAIGASGAALTLVGLVLSCATYVVLGWLLTRYDARDATEDILSRTAVLTGVEVGLFAGLIGGSIRADAVRDYLAETVTAYGVPPDFAIWALAVFVALSVVASAAGGGVLSWLGFRLARRPRPRS